MLGCGFPQMGMCGFPRIAKTFYCGIEKRFPIPGQTAFLLNHFGVSLSETNISLTSSQVEDLFSKDGPVFSRNPDLFEYLENYTRIFQNAGRKLGMPCSLEHQQRMEERREARIKLLHQYAPILVLEIMPAMLNMIQSGLNRSYTEIQKYPKFCQIHPVIKNNDSDLHCGLDEKCCGPTSSISDARSQCFSLSYFNNVSSSVVSDLSGSVKELPTVASIDIHQLPVKLRSSTEGPEGYASSSQESFLATPEPTASTTTTTPRDQDLTTPTFKRNLSTTLEPTVSTTTPQDLTTPTFKGKIQHYTKTTPRTVAKLTSENPTSGNVIAQSGSSLFMLICIMALFVSTL
ncbi:unnamed protein product [Allacma fusca]|uniref:Uncharacterized protein n=1 Tax=Allacma fusca TaxID=39272 RepID=A0A8J2PLJ8_9HEXA|nr:unnamed protein product [Allacma fusca]